MTTTLAVAGKGGTGKSTIASLMIAELLAAKRTPVLGIDADPNSTLNEWLGVEIEKTLGDLEAEVLNNRRQLPAGLEKRRYLENNLQLALAEQQGFDLIAMGRTEGPGCYCYVNNILRDFIDHLTPNYRYVIMDNEAGMEHLSRRTTNNVDYLFIISDESPIGVRSAGRIYQLEKKLEIKVGQAYLIINRLQGELSKRVREEIAGTGLPLLAAVPVDESITEYGLAGKSLLDLPASSPARTAVREILAGITR